MAENSLTFGPLAQSPTFIGRTAYIITIEAPVVLAEANTVPGHTLRAALAASVAANPGNYAPVFARHLSANVNVTGGGALTGTSAAGTLDTPANDAALLAAVAALWPVVAGYVQNP